MFLHRCVLLDLKFLGVLNRKFESKSQCRNIDNMSAPPPRGTSSQAFTEFYSPTEHFTPVSHNTVKVLNELFIILLMAE